MFLFTILNNTMETEQGLLLADGAMCPRSVSPAAAEEAQFHQLQPPAAQSKALSASHRITAPFPFPLPPIPLCYCPAHYPHCSSPDPPPHCRRLPVSLPLLRAPEFLFNNSVSGGQSKIGSAGA